MEWVLKTRLLTQQVLWLECEMHPPGSCMWTFDPQLVAVFIRFETFKRWNLAGRRGLLEASLNFYDPVPLSLCSLLPDYKHNVTSRCFCSWGHIFYAPWNIFPYAVSQSKPSLELLLTRHFIKTRKVINTAGTSRYSSIGVAEWVNGPEWAWQTHMMKDIDLKEVRIYRTMKCL